MRFITTIGIGAALVGAACVDAVPVGPVTSGRDIAASAEVGEAAVGGYRARLLPLAPEQTSSSQAFAVNNHGTAGGFAYRTFRRLQTDSGTFECRSVAAAVLFVGTRVVSLHEDVVNAALRDGYGTGFLCERNSWVIDVNDRGEAVGVTMSVADRPETRRGFFWSPDSGARLLRRDEGVEAAALTGINNDGIAVGHWIDWSAAELALRWNTRSGIVQDTPQFDWLYLVTVSGISESGSVVGCAWKSPFFADGRNTVRLRGYTCGTTTGWGPDREWITLSEAGAVNSGGTVVFNDYPAGPMRWNPLTGQPPAPIGWGAGGVMAVSERDRVVGWRTQSVAPSSEAMTRLADGSVVPLPSPVSGARTAASGVNDCGTIVGMSETFDRYHARATIWTKEGCDPPLK